MNRTAATPPSRIAGRPTRGLRLAAIALLALGSQAGCGREFYREWANQDVTEAVFEKSRDPRWRMDLFSKEPPAMARFADPYDPDRPPAPPDDLASQALSPVPQWPEHRLIMPVEGTGYLKLLDEGPKYVPPKPNPPRALPIVRPLPPPPPTPPPSGTTSPFNPAAPPGGTAAPAGPGPASSSRPNSGTGRDDSSPTSVASNAPKGREARGGIPKDPADPTKLALPEPTLDEAARRDAAVEVARLAMIKKDVDKAEAEADRKARVGKKDQGVRQAAMQQDPTRPMPIPGPTNSPTPVPPPSSVTAPGDRLQTPRIPGDPLPVDADLSKPINPRPDQTTREYQDAEERASNLARMFVPENVPFDEAIGAGLPSESRPYVLTMEKAFQIAILNSRYYQFQLENVYQNALAVTLQRFSFTPQFIAGLSPRTPVAGSGSNLGGILPAQLPANSFLYQTRATGSQISGLNFGTVAGVGKLLNNGTQILASFANSVVFNFVGRNPAQPTVRSFLPLQVLVPFLRGGGRAVTLEALTQAERNLLYSVRSFAKFRQEFVVSTLAGGQIITFGVSTITQGFTSGGNIDPVIGFLNVVEDVQLVENFVKNLAVFDRFALVFEELVQGEGSGLSPLQLDQIRQQVQGARNQLIISQATYRNDLDQYKIQLGMPPDVPLIVDRQRTAGFKSVFEAIDAWALTPRREFGQLEDIVGRIPKLEDIVLDGRSSITIFSEPDDKNLEGLLLIAERVALENRLDLMNARAQLYDAWRQIRVSANALKGIFNVALTNQYITPPTTNNPFGFLDQSKQFSLVFNAELPLVRLAERNNFAQTLINYQRQRRTLQNTEDFLKYQLRNEIRQMELLYRQYEITKRNLILAIRLKDQAFEQIIAPPTAQAGNQAAALQTTNLINFQQTVVTAENTLISTWYQYQTQRLQVYRDLGILPFDEWEAFDEIFPPDRSGGSFTAAVDRDGRPAVARAVKPPIPAADSPVGRN